MARLPVLVCGALIAALLPAQNKLVIPRNAATAPGNSSNNFPWATLGSTTSGIRVLSCYDSSNFTDALVAHPIAITRLRWRADDLASEWVGGSYPQAAVRLSTAAVDYTAVSTTWAANHGPDLTVCHTGAVTMQAGIGNGPGLPGPFHVDIPFAVPFVYDPTQGDLVIDCEWTGVWVGGTRTPLDVDTTSAARASRVFASSHYPNANGTTANHGLVVEVTWAPVAGSATALPYGDACYDRFATFYESFAAGTFDLSDSTLAMLPAGNDRYVVVHTPGAPAWFTPSSSPLSMAGDGVRNLALPFTYEYPGGTTNKVFMSSNGFFWTVPFPFSGCCVPTVGELVNQPARFAALWCDLDPSNTGMHFDVDPAGDAVYLTFVDVPERQQQQNLNTFQIRIADNGPGNLATIEYRYRQCAVTAHRTLVGWSPGGGARPPAAIDVSTASAFTTSPDTNALHLAASARPVLGTTAGLVTSEIASGSTFGFLGYAFGSDNVELGAFGLPDCYTLLAPASVVFSFFVPTGSTAPHVLAVPNDPGLVGLHVHAQSAAMAPGANAAELVTSNGVDLILGSL